MSSAELAGLLLVAALLFVWREGRLRQQAQEELGRFFTLSLDMLCISSADGHFKRVSPAFTRTLGWSVEEFLARPFLDAVHPDDRQPTLLEVERQVALGETVLQFENRYQHKDGSWRMLSWKSVPQPGGLMYATARDITERIAIEAKLMSSLREKEALLKEVHHRVKNNLALIISLMRLEAGRTHSAETREVLQEMQARIRSVVLLNETLYRTESYSRVNLADYLKQIATHLFRAHQAANSAVRLVLDLEDVQLETRQAIPCGLIVNELLTNTLKHGFADGRSGEARITLRRETDGTARLRVSDTGAGLPEDYAAKQSQSLGLQLVNDLVRQLQGSLEVGPGATFTMTFRPRLGQVSELVA